MFQKPCTELALKLNRIVHSRKSARYFAGFFSMSFLSVCALMGRFLVPSQELLNKGSAVILTGTRTTHSPLRSFPMRH
jgi:hypothetical protein